MALLLSRRWLVSGSTALLFGGCGDDASNGGTECETPSGDRIGEAALLPEPTSPLDTKTGVGWDARLFYDLSNLSAETLVTPNELFYLRTEFPDLLDETQPWSVLVHGLVTQSRTLGL